MEIYLLTERAKSNGQYHDRVVGCYESYNYAVIEKAKLEQSGTLNTYFISEQDLHMGEVTVWEDKETEDLMLKNEDFDTIAMIDFDPFENFYDVESGTFNSGTVQWETVTKWEVDEITVFGQSVDSLGIDEVLTRDIKNQVEYKVEKLND